MTEEPIEPLFSHQQPGPRFRAKDLASALVRNGVPHSTASARIGNYAKARQIHARGQAGTGAANSPNLFAISDVAAAVMLSNLQDCGVRDQDILALASATLYGWNADQKGAGSSPILTALRDTWNGDPWALELRFFRHPDRDELAIDRAFYRLGARPVWSQKRLQTEAGWAPVASLMVNTGQFSTLKRLIEAPKGAN